MAVTPKVLLKRSSVAGKVPTTSDLSHGELAVNFADGKIYYKNSSNQIKAFVDSARVEAIANAVEVIALAQLDSGEVTNLIDSSYIQTRIPESYLSTLIDSAYVNLRADHYTTANFNTDFASKSTSDLTEGSNLYYTKARADSDISSSLSDSGNTVNVTINNTITDTVDSAYVLARVAEAPFLNSADAVNLIDSAYIQARQADLQRDSAFVTDIVDSAYVRLRQLKTFGLAGNTGSHTYNTETETLTFLGQTGQINAEIAANNVSLTLDQNINSITSVAFEGDSANSNETKVQAVNPTKDNTINLPDSSGTIALLTDIVDTQRDSAFITNIIDSAYIQLRQTSGGSGTVDSAAVLALVDSAYIKTVGGIDADTLDGQHGSFYTNYNNLSNAPTVLDLTDVSSRITNDVTKSFVDALNINADLLDGQHGAYYLDYTNFTNKPTIPAFGTDFVDSGTVLDIINSQGLESDLVKQLVDSAYIQLRDRFQDSSLVTSTVDSAYIQIRRPAAAAFAVVNNGSGAYDFDGDGFSGNTSNPTLYLQRGLKYKFSVNASGHPFYIKTNNVIGTGSAYNTGVTNNGAQVGDIFFEVPMNAPDTLYYICQYHSQMQGVIRIFDHNSFADSAVVSSIITADVDQAFVNALNIDADNLDGQTGTFYLDYNNFTNTPTAYSLTVQEEGSSLSTGATTLNFVGSAVTASGTGTTKTITITQASGGTDSATVTSLINSTVDSAYVQLRQSSTGTGGLDSALTTQLIDSAYVQLRQSAGGGGGSGLDSALVSQLVDSSYVQLRQLNETSAPLVQTNNNFIATAAQSSFTGLTIDSDKFQVYLNGLLLPRADYTHNTTKVDLKVAADSGDVVEVIKFGGNTTTVGTTPFTQTFFTKTLDSGALSYSGNDDNGNSLSYTAGAIAVYLNGILLLDTVDYTATNGTSITLLDSASAEGGDKLTVLKFGGNTTGVDSADVINLLPTLGTDFIDSAEAIKLITANAIDSSVALQLLLDSAETIGLIDSDYVRLRVTKSDLDMEGNKVLFGNLYDSIGALPSASTYHGMFAHVHATGAAYYAHAGAWLRLANYSELTSAGLDSALITQLIDSDYVQLREGAGGGGSGTVDSAQTISLIQSTVDSAYIGTKVDFTRGEFTTQRSQYTATSSQTAFSHSSIDPTHLDVYLNGVLQVVGTDYNASATAVTFTTGVDSGHSVTIVERRGRVATQRGLAQQSYYYTTATPTTAITGADDNGVTLDYSSGALDVFLNGILLKDSDDYATNAGTTVTLVSATDSGDLVTLINRKGIIVSPTVKNYEYTATASQTTFTGADINGATLAYSADAIQVHLNGIILRNTDYTAVNGTSITLASGANVNDELIISAFSNPGHNMELYKFTADSAQTVFSGNDLTGKSLAYSPGNIQVHLNGLLLNDSDDYVANNGMGVRLLTGALANDELKITSFVSNSNTVRTNAWSAPTDSSITAVAGDKLFIDTSSAKTITLPSSASLGDEIRIIDATDSASANNITVARNGHKIMGTDSDLTINTNRAGLGLVYYNTTQGWLLIEN